MGARKRAGGGPAARPDDEGAGCLAMWWCEVRVAPLFHSLRLRCAISASAPLFFPPLVKGGLGGVGRVTVECTIEHNLGAIDRSDLRRVRGFAALDVVQFPNIVAGERLIH